MLIRLGFELCYQLPKPTPMVLMLNVHYSRVADLVSPDHVRTSPALPVHGYRDGFGNWGHRLVAPAGALRIFSEAVINDAGVPEPTSLRHPLKEARKFEHLSEVDSRAPAWFS